ncbi:MAG: hypothetical protein ACYTKD_04455 [Planctomycetota bacterium]|jgi:hypothetical protein
MGESERTGAPAAPALGAPTILRYEPSRREILLGVDWPAMLYLAFFLHFVFVGFGLSSGVAAPLAVGMSFLFSLNMARLVSGTKLVVVDDGTITFQGLRKKEIALADIEQIALPKRGEFGPARVALEMRRAKPKSFWRLDLSTGPVALPGSVRFQAQIVDAILARRPDLPVDERALRLLGGKLRVLLRHRLPALLASGIGVVTLAAFLAASFYDVFVWFWWYLPLVLPAFAVPFTHCLERESTGKRVIASLGVSALPVVAGLSVAAAMYGGLEYLPLLHASGLALAAGAFVAALPRSPSAGAVGAGTATLLAALVGATWQATLADTIPVREVLLKPPPWSATFAPDSGTLVVTGSPVQEARQYVTFLDVTSGRVRVVFVGDGDITSSCAALPGTRAVCEVSPRGSDRVWFVSADGATKQVPAEGDFTFLPRRAISPDGRTFAFCTVVHLPKEVRVHSEDCRHVNRIHLLDTGTGDLLRGGLSVEGCGPAGSSLPWRADDRLVWGAIDEERGAEDAGGVFRLFSWAPGEVEPRADFESCEKWSDTGLSPSCEKAVTYVYRRDSRTAAVVSFADGSMIEAPGLEPHRTLYPSAHWSEDGNDYVFVPEAEPRIIRILRTATGEVSTLWRAPSGEVSSTLVSPDGRRVAFILERELHRSIFIADTTNGMVRRLRPVGMFMLLLSDLPGYAAWSPDGKWFAIPAIGSRLALTASSGMGPLWLVSADDM